MYKELDEAIKRKRNEAITLVERMSESKIELNGKRLTRYGECNSTILECACEQGMYDLVSKLIELKVNVNEETGGGGGDRVIHLMARSMLCYGIQDESVEIVELLAQVPDLQINAQNHKGDTAMHFACKSRFLCNKQLGIIVSLLSRGDVDLSIKNNLGEVAFYKFSAGQIACILHKVGSLKQEQLI